ncbi:DUF885 family protein [Erysipelotrichaceae bacterium RD49]|nr:DUF885 family protein [Erysipelotrichaceae bacterium RD49]
MKTKFKRYVNRLFLVFLSALLAAGCTSSTPETSSQSSTSSRETSQSITPTAVSNAEFENFLDQYVIQLCENDYLLTHRYFEHPENYGIDIAKCRITLGSFTPDEKDIAFEKKALNILENFEDTNLNAVNKQIRSQMIWELNLALNLSDEKFEYLGSIWSEISGVQASLTDTFAEFQLYSQADIEPLIALINDVPRYVNEAIVYSQNQAKAKTLAIDLDTVISTCQSIVNSKDDSPVTRELMAEVDALGLDQETAERSKTQIREALQKSFFPSFQTIIDGLGGLKDQNGAIKGMASYKNGREAYQYVLQSYAGSNDDIEVMKEEIRTAMDNAVTEYRLILREDPESAMIEEPQTQFKSVSEIMPFLEERYPAEFPIVKTMDYEIKELSPEQSKNGVMAYFVIQPIDSRRPYEIRYNARDYGSDPESLTLYNTFAHEGIPGHMYQAQYNRDHFKHPIQYFLSSFGMQEGYATYAAYQTIDWTGIDENVTRVWELTDQYSNYSVLLMDIQINYDDYSLAEFENVWGKGSEAIYNQLAENPGVFFGYYYGCMKILQLQEIAKESLGDLYDPVDFNNALLQAGDVHFGLIEENIQSYINNARSSAYGSDKPKENDASSSKSEQPSAASSNEDSSSSAQELPENQGGDFEEDYFDES